MKSLINIRSVTLSLIIFTFSSCANYTYLPTKQNVMLFDKKGDIVLSASSGSYDEYGFEAGYAFCDFLGAYSSYHRFNISSGGSDIFDKDYIWDNELIAFKKFDNGYYTALNAGIGVGHLNTNNPYYSLNLNRDYLLPSVGYQFKNGLFILGSVRINWLNYDIKPLMNLSTAYDQQKFYRYFNLTSLQSNKNFFTCEPALTAGWDFKFMKLEFQTIAISYVKPTSLNYYDSNFITSVSFYLDKIFAKKK